MGHISHTNQNQIMVYQPYNTYYIIRTNMVCYITRGDIWILGPSRVLITTTLSRNASSLCTLTYNRHGAYNLDQSGIAYSLSK